MVIRILLFTRFYIQKLNGWIMCFTASAQNSTWIERNKLILKAKMQK